MDYLALFRSHCSILNLQPILPICIRDAWRPHQLSHCHLAHGMELVKENHGFCWPAGDWLETGVGRQGVKRSHHPVCSKNPVLRPPENLPLVVTSLISKDCSGRNDQWDQRSQGGNFSSGVITFFAFTCESTQNASYSSGTHSWATKQKGSHRKHQTRQTTSLFPT